MPPIEPGSVRQSRVSRTSRQSQLGEFASLFIITSKNTPERDNLVVCLSRRSNVSLYVTIILLTLICFIHNKNNNNNININNSNNNNNNNNNININNCVIIDVE